ncbi:MAG: hypothetical protein JWO42_3728 [Chloroflexi bacterium]|jgi:hypothetical protein|nr:hypothetical protein [Chloroflexota bacterium]
MPPTLRSIGNVLSFDEVLRRLAQQDVVDGLVVLGSAAGNALNLASDYDLYLVLSAMPAPIHVGLTWIDGRLTDLVFEHASAVDRYLEQEDPLPTDAGQERLTRYVTTGRIVVDRHARLERVHHKIGNAQGFKPLDESAIYRIWFGVNYNLQQTKRMLASDDPVYARAIDIRLLYSTAEIMLAYFQMRRLPWRGEKEAIRYFTNNDPGFLRVFEEYADANDRAAKVQAYEQLAAQALAPLGGVWPDGVTVMQLEGPDSSSETAERVLAFWEELLTT